MSWAKGIGGGFPLGAIWVSDRPVKLKTGATIPLCDLLGPGSHGTTFGGTPLVSAGANEVLAVIEDEGLLANAREMGSHAVGALCALGSPLIAEVRGVGLMIGIELVSDFSSKVAVPANRPPSLWMTEQFHESGLLTVPSGTHAFRWLPALNVSRSEIDSAVEITANLLHKLARDIF